MLPGKKYKPEDVFWMVWRRKWALVIPFVLVSIGTFLYARSLPNLYRSETVMLIEPQQVPESYVRPTVTTRVQDRLRSVRETALTRTRLEKIITDLNLYPAERSKLPLEDVIEKMRKDVSVEVGKGETFRFGFVYTDPKKAMQVVQTISESFTDANRVDRSTVAASTTQFLGRQLEDARKRLEEQERKIADFQRNHAGQLPSERDANLQVMHNLQLQVQTLSDSMNRDRDRRLFLERVLADLEPQAQTVRKNTQDTQVNAAEGSVTRVGSGTAAEQLESAREALKGLEMHLKPEHPDVQYMNRLIADLEVKAKAEAAAPPAATSRPPRPRNQEEAATLRRIQEAKEEIAAVDIQIASKQAEEKRIRAEITTFQGRVAATPGLEADYTSLTRDYETVRMAYQSLLAKQEDSKIAKNLVDEKIGETFATLDAARMPESPFKPNRLMINLIGSLIGLGVGFGLVALLDYKDRGLRTEDDVLAVLNLPVLATIPVIGGGKGKLRERRRRLR